MLFCYATIDSRHMLSAFASHIIDIDRLRFTPLSATPGRR
jgi:hypothetical protein